MIKEHEEIMTYLNISLFQAFEGKYSVSYIDKEFYACEVLITGDKSSNELLFNKIIKKIKNDFEDVISEVLTLERGSLYVIFLLSQEKIRKEKINTIKNKMYGN